MDKPQKGAPSRPLINERTYQRVPTSVPVNVTISTPQGHSIRAERMGNLSLGGMFLETADPPVFGTELTLEFRLDAEHRIIRCKGFVAWTTRREPTEQGVSGMGVRLTDISIADMKMLSEFIDSRIKRK